MTKKERIAELERKVAELEARPTYAPYWSVIPPWSWYAPVRCSNCGAYGAHICNYYVTSGTTTDLTGAWDTNITYIGAAS